MIKLFLKRLVVVLISFGLGGFCLYWGLRFLFEENYLIPAACALGLWVSYVIFVGFYPSPPAEDAGTEYFPPRSKKQAGMDYERACAQRLIRQGYTNVKLTPASGDFGADILAVHPKGYRICFQCKFYSGNVGVEAVQEVLSAVRYYGADCGAVMTNADFTPAARELARRSDVALIPHCDAHLDWIDRVEDFDAIWN